MVAFKYFPASKKHTFQGHQSCLMKSLEAVDDVKVGAEELWVLKLGLIPFDKGKAFDVR